ncbi:MAG: molybdopterin molybdenumtransferase MoeA, partial [Methanomicrobium sp.]|nr:molybdopterin molybdenumtransferase MoeA [Methanomicrobium sp.]
VLVRHMLRRLCGLEKDTATLKSARLLTNISSEKGREEYVRVRITEEGLAEPLFGKSGLLNTIVESDGVIKIPAGCEGLEAGESVEVFMW